MIKINLLGTPSSQARQSRHMTVMPTDGPSPLFAVLIVLVLAGLGNGAWYYMLDKRAKDIQQQIAQADQPKNDLRKSRSPTWRSSARQTSTSGG